MRRLLATGALATSAVMVAGMGIAHAAPTGQDPRFYQAVGLQPMRAAGSETTFYMMNALGDLYTQSAIFGCVLSSSDFRTCQTGSDGSATDTKDNYSRDEFINGAGIGSGKGISQLCGNSPTGGLTVDFARSSRALQSGDFSGSCNSSNLLPENYADDAVQPLDFQHVGTTAIAGTPACTSSTISSGLIHGTCQIGPVAAGWLPGDPLAGPYTGKAFNNITTTGGAASLANRIYTCSGNPNPITDWGQLTNISGSQTPGSGTPIGVPIYVPAVNTGSGTYSTWKGVVGCDPNTPNKDGQLAQENDAPQMADLAFGIPNTKGGALNALRWPDYNQADAPLSGTAANVDASNQVAASFYYVSFGVSQWRSFTASVAIPSGCTSGCLNKSSGSFLSVDNVTQSPACDFPSGACFDNDGNPVNQSNSARQLFNIVRTDTLKGSVAGFLNFICDAQKTGEYGTDLTTGKNYGTEIQQLVSGTFFFPYQPCTKDGTGHSTAPFVAPGETPPAGGAAVPAANLAS